MGGRIECVFFSEFHPTLGPKITYQVWGLSGSGSGGEARTESTCRGPVPGQGLGEPGSPFPLRDWERPWGE